MEGFETIDDHLEKIVAIIKRDVVKDVMSQDVRVLNQKTVFYKFWCWFWYRHLFEYDVCLRCGAVRKHTTKNRE